MSVTAESILFLCNNYSIFFSGLVADTARSGTDSLHSFGGFCCFFVKKKKKKERKEISTEKSKQIQ